VVISSPAINEKGVVYFTSVDGRLYALDENGNEKWHLWTGGVGKSSPVLDGDGNIYLGVNNMFWSVSPEGKKRWDFGYPVVEGAAAVASDGMVYFSGLNSGVGVLYEFTAEGTLKTYTRVGGSVRGAPTMEPDGTIIMGSGSLQAWKGSAGLGKGAWPKFRGGPRQTGRIDAE
jgi:outer membrane protein assembly factor BamB